MSWIDEINVSVRWVATVAAVVVLFGMVTYECGATSRYQADHYDAERSNRGANKHAHTMRVIERCIEALDNEE